MSPRQDTAEITTKAGSSKLKKQSYNEMSGTESEQNNNNKNVKNILLKKFEKK